LWRCASKPRSRWKPPTATFDRLPDGTPFDRFFRRFGPEAEEFFRRGPGGGQTGPRNPRRGGGQGSGFFISEDGYLVTNNHVIEGAGTVQIVMDNGDILDAEVLGTDSRTDLALLKVEGNGFTYVRLAEEQPRIGEIVLAIGNPFGLGGSVTLWHRLPAGTRYSAWTL
jgi:serine protease Do